jgi:hypothetical protein
VTESRSGRLERSQHRPRVATSPQSLPQRLPTCLRRLTTPASRTQHGIPALSLSYAMGSHPLPALSSLKITTFSISTTSTAIATRTRSDRSHYHALWEASIYLHMAARLLQEQYPLPPAGFIAHNITSYGTRAWCVFQAYHAVEAV